MPNVLIETNPFLGEGFIAPSFNGEGNNEANPKIGAAGSALLNVSPLSYEDDVSLPTGESRPDPRTVSNAIAHQNQEIPSPQGLTNMVWAMGQFLDHDLSLTPSFSRSDAIAQGETMDMPIAVDDPYMNPTGIEGLDLKFQRSKYFEGTGIGENNPRQLPNEITAWVDGSNIYGSDDERSALLRSFSGGLLKVGTGNLLPIDPGNNNDNPGPASELFIAGDVRANENIVLSSMHTLFVREHNRFAAALARVHSDWSDEQLFQRARQLNVAQLQHIIFEEYLPAILGKSLGSYRGYDSSIDAGISREFSTAAFRFGHTMVSPTIARWDNQGKEIAQGNVNLAQAFFPNLEMLQGTGIDPILRGSASTLAQKVDSKVISELRNLLFSFGGQFAAQDLYSLNIQRGRDHGLADFNTIRESFGLERVTSFSQITSDTVLQAKLQELYGSVDNVDAIVGMFSETPDQPTQAFGETIVAVLVEQFTRLRDGDRFYYKNVLSEAEIAEIETTSMADIIRRNTNTRIVQDNVFTLKQTGDDLNDLIRGGLGNDTLEGGAGNDKLIGFWGDDLILGHEGDDILKGDQGNDSLQGGHGHDKLYGREGRDRLQGQDGDDFLHGGFDRDRLDGGNGNDTLDGGAGVDFLIGGFGDDRLSGGGQNDTLLGTLHSRRGANERDTLAGGAGRDRFILGNKVDIFYAQAGENDYAHILDFNVNQDRLVLHGSREQYQTQEMNGMTNLRFGETQELIAIFVGSVSLDDANVMYRA